jgi:hypothetical protein
VPRNLAEVADEYEAPASAGECAIDVARVQITDFHAYMPTHSYIFAPTGEMWPAASVNSLLPPIAPPDSSEKPVPANKWLDQNRAVEQMTWAPGEPQIVTDKLISDGGWFARPGGRVFNLYRPPTRCDGKPELATPWLEHVRRVYPTDADHLIKWFAHRVQRPGEKINHAIVMGGEQGVGKDTLLEPVKEAVGPWNFQEVSPIALLGRFNGFVKSVILRVSEARDLGDLDRFTFYDHTKTLAAAPPDVLRVDEKHLREYAVFNVCGMIITTNHKTDGLFLPPDDRRHYVAWSDCTRDEFSEEYWNRLWDWYAEGGLKHVAAYLARLPLDDFNPKAPPEKTPAFWDIVQANQAPEEAELADALDRLNWPHAVTIDTVATAADGAAPEFAAWLRERKNSRRIPHKMDKAGYCPVQNESAQDGLFKIGDRRCRVYAKKALATRDRFVAAERLVDGRFGGR